MELEGDLRNRETAMKPQNHPVITNQAKKNEPYIGVTSLGTPVVYRGNNKKYKESEANQNAETALRAISRGISGDTSISLNTKTGNIKVSAPKAILNSEDGKKIINNDTLMAMSQAYKLNHDYKITYTERDEKGQEVKSEVTIPEYIAKLDSSLKVLASNMRNADAVRYHYVKEYGDKAERMTDEMIRMSLDYEGDALPISQFIANAEVLKGISPYAKDGRIKIDDLKKFYTRDKLGREEMARLIGEINVRLKNGEWSEKEYYTDEDGEEILDQNNVREMARALAFKNYILANDPDASWIQSVGDNIEAMSFAALAGFTRVFANIANVGQAVVTLGQGQEVQNWIQDMDKSMAQYKIDEELVNDATATTYTLGMLGGTIAGTVASSWLGGEILSGAAGLAGSAANGITAKALASAAESLGLAKDAATIKDVLTLAKNGADVSRGALFVLKAANAAQKAQIAAGIAKAFLDNHKTVNFIVDFLTDTVHDALLYDSTTLREALQSSDQETRDFWLGQLADNAKWWGGMAAGKTMMKWAGKTTLGQAANVLFTKLNAKIASGIGNKWAKFKDYMAGGSVKEELQKKLDKAVKNGKLKTANRIRQQIQQENWNAALRSSKQQLAKMKLDWDGLKLTEKSADQYRDVMTRIKALNNGIDSYNRNISFKRQEMVGRVRDPATGKINFINPDLGGANEKATSLYIKMSEALSKKGIAADPDSLVNQATVNYMMGQYHLEIAKAFSQAGGDMADDALNAIPIIEKNIAAAKAQLPDEVVKIVDEGLSNKTYQSFYAQLNEYGRSKGLLNKDKTRSYEANQIWAENGYMPIVVEHPKTGHWETDTGRIDSVIDQDFKKMTFKVQEGQNYVDPEIIRQTRISTMARAEVNRDLFKAYSGYGSNATNITKISGEDTEYARKVTENAKALNQSVEKNASAFAENFEVELQKQRRRKPVKNVTVDNYYREEALSGLPLSETSQLLLSKGTFKHRGQKLTDGVTRGNYDKWYSEQTKPVRKYLDQQYSRLGRAGDRGYDALKTSVEVGGSDFEAGLERAYLMGDPSFAKSSTMNEAMRNIQNGKNAFYEGVVKARAKANLRNVTTVKVDGLVDDIQESIEKNIETYVGGVIDDAGAKAAINALAENSNGADAAGRYIALKQLSDNKAAREAAYKSMDDEIDKLVKGKNISTDDAANIKKQAHEMFDASLGKELDDASNSARTINPDLVNADDVFDKAKELNKDIVGAEAAIKADDGMGTVMYLDADGRQVFAQVDPAFASLYNYRYKMDKTEASVLAKTNAAMSKLFRYGTTSVNLTAFGNQLFRDFGNALLVGGAWQTIKTNADNLVDVFGDNIVDQIKRFDPDGYEMRQIERLAEANGQTIQQAAVSRELMRGAAISPTTTERTLYKDFMKQAYGGNTDDVILGVKTKFQEIVDKYNPDELLNGKRENYLRNRVYASSLNDAMKQGYTIEQARVYAEFAMNNATTNFSRQLYHMQAIADSTPYFRAAINGTKSFWRMWSLDPVGITGRIMGGLILPTMYLTGASLGSKEDREIYNNIPEYQKKDSMVFVHDGNIISVPIPQELSAIVAPFRQFVEYLHGADQDSFWELMQNDVLGFSPIDLTGFTTIDMDRIINDPTILDRMSRGFARVFSQMAPIPVKTAYMLATGTDPYTGKKLSDPSYSWYNDATDSVEVMDYTQNTFAKWFAGLFGDNMSSAMAEKIISGIIGTTGINILGDLTSLLQEGPEAWVESAGSHITGQLKKPFYNESYDEADSAWKRAVRQLTAEKNSILAEKEFKTLLKTLSQEKDPDERKKISAQIQNIVNDYQQKVATAVKRLGSEYKGTFDRKKFAATIQLLNFNTDAAYQDGTQLSSDRSSATYWSGRDAAIQTMNRLGITGTNDMSIFGYGTVNKDGEIEIKYSDPVAIMEAENVWSSQNDLHLANIKSMVKQAGLWDAKDAVDAQVDAIYSKSKLTDKDYDKINAIYIEWNARVMSALAPYISEMTPEAAINNSAVMDYLDSLFEVPSEFKKDKYGRYVTNKKLGEGSAKDAYIKNYIRKIFKVNNSGYEGGKNYSGRK